MCATNGSNPFSHILAKISAHKWIVEKWDLLMDILMFFSPNKKCANRICYYTEVTGQGASHCLSENRSVENLTNSIHAHNLLQLGDK